VFKTKIIIIEFFSKIAISYGSKSSVMFKNVHRENYDVLKWSICILNLRMYLT